MTPAPTNDALTSSGFVARAIEVARNTDSWDEADRAFSGQRRWDSPIPRPGTTAVECGPGSVRAVSNQASPTA